MRLPPSSFHFPRNFIWGVSAAAPQIEGASFVDGKGESVWDRFARRRGAILNGDRLDPACDHYHRYPEDIGILADLGFNAYRFSLEWSRIQPEPGYFSRAALDHYRRMIGTCLDQGITPVVTYNHFTTPRWFAGDGGWGSASSPDHFARYAARTTDHLGDLLAWVCTLNEPNLMTMMFGAGVLSLGSNDGGLGGNDRTPARPPARGSVDSIRRPTEWA